MTVVRIITAETSDDYKHHYKVESGALLWDDNSGQSYNCKVRARNATINQAF